VFRRAFHPPLARRRRQQLRDVFYVERFPVMTWMLAGSVLVVAWFVDLPNRKASNRPIARAARIADSRLQEL
jgi:hypothetical protein